jgi:M6 family metalloprotease-like protein
LAVHSASGRGGSDQFLRDLGLFLVFTWVMTVREMAMNRRVFSGLVTTAFAFLVLWGSGFSTAEEPVKNELVGYCSPEKAITTTIKTGTSATTVGQTGYLGVSLSSEPQGHLKVTEVAEGSSAAKAGLAVGDEIKQVDGQAVSSSDNFRELVQAGVPGSVLKLTIVRKDQTQEIKATLGATSKPLTLSSQRPNLGFSFDEPKQGEGAAITRIQPDSPASRTNLKVGEHIVKVDGEAIHYPGRVNDLIAEKKPGDSVTLTLKREDKEVDMRLTLGSEAPTRRFDFREPSYWKKPAFRLAVIGVEYPDVKHNDKAKSENWTELFFSKKTYTNKSATGDPVHGSVYDYYHEISYGALELEGKFFNWVEVSKKRADYSQGTGTSQAGKSAFLTEVLDKLYSRDGKDALKDFDGIVFLYAGGRVQTSRGGLYWPHRASFNHQQKRWNYAIFPEGGEAMTNISVICHEFGHILGLPDLYARPENPGSEGAGQWCAMSNQLGRGRPQHFSAWCKEKLGWIKPALIDPTVKQKLLLDPIEDSPKECYKVLVKRDGSEYYLLENRNKKGFDKDLPAEGLLVWRIVGNRPILEEAHGVEGPRGPVVFLGSVPFPSPSNNSFTPFTTPTSKSQLGGGLPVYITNIRRLPNGRIAFQIGYEYQ